MKDPFSRIIQDPTRFGGIPHIIDTNVTVREIVSATLAGQEIDELLERYTDISVQDIHQALAYTIQNIQHGISHWRHDGINPLTQIKGYSEILVGKTKFEDLDQIPDHQKQQWMQIIHSSSQRGIARWQQMGQWLSTQYQSKYDDELEDFTLSEFIDSILEVAIKYEPSLKFNVNIPPDDIILTVSNDAVIIFASTLAFARTTFHPSIRINVFNKQSHIIIDIEQDLVYEEDDIQKLIFNPYTPITTAMSFSYQNNIGFSVEKENNTLIFTIELSNDNQS